jgi:seryl-tRNA synthetase
MPPFFMNKDQMAKTAQLDQFDEELYKVRARASEGREEGRKGG